MNKLVDRIAEGTADLVGINYICKTLNVSRATVNRWIENELKD